MAPEFEWDAQKTAENLENHGVAFAEALTVSADPLANIFDDPDHSDDERRELIIGHSAKGGDHLRSSALDDFFGPRSFDWRGAIPDHRHVGTRPNPRGVTH
jgi:hypothetical protein